MTQELAFSEHEETENLTDSSVGNVSRGNRRPGNKRRSKSKGACSKGTASYKRKYAKGKDYFRNSLDSVTAIK